MNYALNLPINTVSFGQVSVALLREIYKKEHQPCLFPIGNLEINAQKEDKDFFSWIESCINKATYLHDKTTPIFKLWHFNGSLSAYSKKQLLLSFYELDQPTREEINIIKNNDKVLFSCNQPVETFKSLGIDNVGMVPLGFDSENFKKKDKTYFSDGRVTFNLTGKFEKRKHHEKVIKSWIKKYGNNPKYFLQCAIWNPFLKPEDNEKVVQVLTEGKKYFNVNFLGFMPTNDVYNDFLNSADIILGMSGGEGWGLPEFQSVALGKHAVILNASGYTSWANEDNSVLVEPSGKIEAYDNMFFNKGQPWNQGNIHDFNEDVFLDACEKAIERFRDNKENEKGLELQKEFTYEKTWNLIESELEKL